MRRVRRSGPLHRRVLAVCVIVGICLGVGSWAFAAGETTVRVWTFVDPEGTSSRGMALKQIIQDFEKKHPDIKVKVEVSPWAELSMKYMLAWEAGNPPDVSWIEIYHVPKAIEQGSLEDLMPWIKRWPSGSATDFPRALWDVGVVEGRKYALTTFHMTHALGYRKSLFAKAGLDADSLKSWDEFVEAAQKLTVDSGGRSALSPGFNAAMVSMWGLGMARTKKQDDLPLERLMASERVAMIDPKTLRANWVNPVGVKCMTLLTDFITKYKMESPKDLTYNNEDQANNLAAGLFAIGVAGSQKLADIRKKAVYGGDDIGLMRWPTFDGRPEGAPADTWGWAVVVSSRSRNKDAAWKFLEHYVSPESDLIMTTVGGQLPTRMSTLAAPYFTKPEAAAARWYLKYMSDTSFMTEYRTATEAAEELILAFHEIVLQGKPVEKALRDAADRYARRLE